MAMRINKGLVDWIHDHSANIWVMGITTFCFPKSFVWNYYLNNQTKKINWEGKKSCFTISFDCDYPQDVEAIPAVLKILEKYKLKTSFACVGYWIEKYPRAHKMILDYGHEIVNHTYSHPDNEILNPKRKFKEISRSEKKEEIERCHDVCKTTLNYEPVGCRIPHFKNLFSPDIYGILKELNYRYSSSTLTMNTGSYGIPFRTDEGIVEFPLTTCPRHPFTVFDTWHSFNSPRIVYRLVHSDEKSYIDLFKLLIRIGIQTNSYMNLYIDPLDVVKMKEFDALMHYMSDSQTEVLIGTYENIMEILAKTDLMRGR